MFHTLQKWGGVTALAASVLAFSAPVQAVTLFGNYSSVNDTALLKLQNADQKAVGFTLPVGSDYTLNSITLRLANYNTTDGDAALLQIFADAPRTSANPNGAILQSVVFNNPTSNSNLFGNFVFTPQTPFTFLANTRYWLLVDRTAGDFDWYGNFGPSLLPTSTLGIVSNRYQLSNNDGFTYGNNTFFNSFQIDGTEVTAVPFEFSPALGVGVLGAAFMVKKKLKKKAK
jgi:hypothetical protein